MPVRERLLTAADELFYAEGVHTVGIDRVLEHAGVAKASLYGTFGSKDELVRAYLEERGRATRARTAARMETFDDPRDKILCVFDLLAETAKEGSFRGCAFVNACAEGPKGPTPARDVSSKQRKWRRDLFAELAKELGVGDPEETARQLALLYDGAVVGAWMDADPSRPMTARRVAESLLHSEVPASAPPKAHARSSKKRASAK